MAVSKGINSYATVEEADLYFADRLDTAAWIAASPTEKGQALVTATSLLDNMTWTGSAVSETQNLAFPRVCEYFDPKVGGVIYSNGAAVPQRIISAVYELAYHLINNDGVLDDTGSVRSISVSTITLTDVQAASKIPFVVKSCIKPLLVNAGTNPWWRAN
jgi:hypothetical protein